MTFLGLGSMMVNAESGMPDFDTHFEDTLKHYKKSRQREQILTLLKTSNEHLSADEIYHRLKDDFPRISLGTVYRNLGVLHEQNRIRKLSFVSGRDRFDGRTGHHYHFLCERCNSIFDVELDIEEDLDGLLTRTTGHCSDRHQIEFYGICRKCRAKSGNTHDQN